jgi:hypothetical protein
VIGGYAVAAHGHTRSTFDIDFLVPRADKNEWAARAAESGFAICNQTENFIQFAKPEPQDILDIMLATEPTFEKLWNASVEKVIGGEKVLVPALDHLLALKLHAFKQRSDFGNLIDAQDIEMLARRNNLDLSREHYRDMFLKHGTEQIYQTMLRILKH